MFPPSRLGTECCGAAGPAANRTMHYGGDGAGGGEERQVGVVRWMDVKTYRIVSPSDTLDQAGPFSLKAVLCSLVLTYFPRGNHISNRSELIAVTVSPLTVARDEL